VPHTSKKLGQRRRTIEAIPETHDTNVHGNEDGRIEISTRSTNQLFREASANFDPEKTNLKSSSVPVIYISKDPEKISEGNSQCLVDVTEDSNKETELKKIRAKKK